MSLPLEPYSVIDLTRARSGPTCVRQLAEMGAKVIKVESREQDDFTRDEFDFQNLHRNKRSMTLNLKSAEAGAVFRRMVERADIVVENYRPDVKTRLGIDYDALSRINPRLIYASISGFGQNGPYRDRPGVADHRRHAAALGHQGLGRAHLIHQPDLEGLGSLDAPPREDQLLRQRRDLLHVTGYILVQRFNEHVDRLAYRDLGDVPLAQVSGLDAQAVEAGKREDNLPGLDHLAGDGVDAHDRSIEWGFDDCLG